MKCKTNCDCELDLNCEIIESLLILFLHHQHGSVNCTAAMAARQMLKQMMHQQLLICPHMGLVRSVQLKQVRCLNLHEYQSKELMRQNGLTVQKFETIGNVDQVDRLLNDHESSLFACNEYVIKAQVLAGGRGKGHFLKSKLKGGVKLTRDKRLVKEWSEQMLNDRLVTAQTGSDGELVRKLMIAEALDIEKELYLAIVLDRDSGGPMLVACEQGNLNFRLDTGSSFNVIHL